MMCVGLPGLDSVANYISPPRHHLILLPSRTRIGPTHTAVLDSEEANGSSVKTFSMPVRSIPPRNLRSRIRRYKAFTKLRLRTNRPWRTTSVNEKIRFERILCIHVGPTV